MSRISRRELAGLIAGLAQTFDTRELGAMIAAAKLWRAAGDLSLADALPEKEREAFYRLVVRKQR